MVLAAAIKYHIKKTDSTVILCGARHAEIIMQLGSLGFLPRNGYEEIEQGFIDNKGQFLNRSEAFEHAKSCGQLCAKIVHEREMSGNKDLISEDLW